MEKPELLKVESLEVEVGGHKILKGVDLSIREGEIHVLFGPNGSGKTTLLGAIMGLPQYKILSGRIIFKGMDITDMPPNERAKLGIGLAFQKPPAVRGVRLGKLVELINRSGKSVDELAEMLNLNSHLLRDLNLGFSGGETKRSEMLQLLAQ
ncbi:MAG: ABC transporter ATP-binding protein, partial [Candidatus Hydrothermota bacterium]